MRWLKAGTEVLVPVGPFVATADGFTPNIGVEIESADQAALIQYEATMCSTINSNTWASIANMDGWYLLTLTATDTSYPGPLTITIQDVTTYLPVFNDFMVVGQNAYEALIAGTGTLEADVVTVGGNMNLPEVTAADVSGTPTLSALLMTLYMAYRNQTTTTATLYTMSNDAESIVCTATLADDGTTFTRSPLKAG